MNRITAADRKRLGELRVQRSAVRAALVIFATHAPEMGDTVGLTDAWNGLHDAERALDEAIADLEYPAPVIPAHEQGTAALAAQNID